MTIMIKRSLDEWLESVDYSELNSGFYRPSPFSLKFMNFIKLVNGSEGESHKTPVMHLAMLDKITGTKIRTVNLCHRGSGKTTLFMEYFNLYLGMFGEIDGFGNLDSMIYISDSMDNGVKSARKNIEFRWENSEFLQEWMPRKNQIITDNYIEWNAQDQQGNRINRFGTKMFGAKALSLDSPLWLADGGTVLMGDVQVGDRIMGADGLPTTVTAKSEVFHKPMYELVLQDKRTLKVSEDHLNQVWIKQFKSSNTFSTYALTECTLTTKELLTLPMFATDPNGSERPLVWIKNAGPLQYPENVDQLIDPYTVGTLIGDGSMNGKSTGQVPVVLTAHEDDWPIYEKEIPYSFGKVYRDKRNPNTVSRTVLGINHFVSMHGLDTHGNDKRVPHEYLYGSEDQRIALLQGLMDTDGACSKDGKSTFSSNSKGLVEDVMWLTRSLGGEARWVSTGKTNHFKTSVRINQLLFRLPRKLNRQKPPRNDKMAIIEIRKIADEPSQCIAVDNTERQFLAGAGLVRTHNTGLRGTKIFGKRPRFAVLDDLLSDDDAKSKTAIAAIKDTIYKGIDYALDPTKRKIVFNGTPFAKEDPIIEAVESGAWHVNVWPVCTHFPCDEKDFHGSWEDRFTYDFVKGQYDVSVATGKVSAFNQELMLQISSEEERLVQDSEIRWYKRQSLLKNKGRFNFYITTDFATSDKQTADFSCASVWAYNSNGDWFWVDGFAERQTMEKTIDQLFNLISEYRPQQVGVEVTGQQFAFITWLQEEQMRRNIYFNFAQEKGRPGVRPTANKLSRFNLVVPLFKQGKIYYPEEMKSSNVIGEHIQEIRLATFDGLKGKDDCLDTISMLLNLTPWKPTEDVGMSQNDAGIWDDDDDDDHDGGGMASYVV